MNNPLTISQPIPNQLHSTPYSHSSYYPIHFILPSTPIHTPPLSSFHNLSHHFIIKHIACFSFHTHPIPHPFLSFLHTISLHVTLPLIIKYMIPPHFTPTPFSNTTVISPQQSTTCPIHFFISLQLQPLTHISSPSTSYSLICASYSQPPTLNC